MNKQELIDVINKKIECWSNELHDDKDDYALGSYDSYTYILKYAKQLDEPKECHVIEFKKQRYPKDKKLIKYYGCSICEYDLGYLPCDTIYCPNCGAKIVKEGE